MTTKLSSDVKTELAMIFIGSSYRKTRRTDVVPQ